MNNQLSDIRNSRFMGQINWHAAFASAGLIIILPYLARRFGFMGGSLGPQNTMNQVKDVAQSATSHLGMGNLVARKCRAALV